ncbi:MAG: RnfABCDGE type electron transport complex subunit D [Elusimicrobiota bacterium]
MSTNKKKTKKPSGLNIIPAPHAGGNISTSKMMRLTLVALLFPAAGGVYFFGLPVLYLLVVCAASALVAEYAALMIRRSRAYPGSYSSALVSGVILALVLPASFPLWAASLGAIFAILIVKHVFGGLGKNIFNPALMGRAFLAAAFPLIITQYSLSPRPLPAALSSGPDLSDAVSEATPLNRVKFEEQKPSSSSLYLPFLLGEKKGSSGETSAFLILIGLALLLASGVADWRLPFSYFSSFMIFSSLLWLFDPGSYLNPVFSLLLGSVLLGGTYMLTDPATTPSSPKGKLLFGAGAGFLTVLIRTFIGYPEGVMFAILIMNAFTPLIERYVSPRIYGT